MSAELEPEPPRAERDRHRWVARGKRWGEAVLAWTPVWVPLVFLLQLVALGLWPARAEAARLDRAAAEVNARAEALAQEEQALANEARMLEDGVYQERVRRSLLDPAAAPLTLERARAGRAP
jgi:cell division protein FtsB